MSVQILGRQLPAWAGSVLRFLIVGGLAAALDFAILSSVIALGGSKYWGRCVSVAVTVVFTWALNRSVTFRAEARPSWREFAHYVATALGGMLLNLGLYSAALWAGAPVWAAFVFGTGLTAIYSFLRYRAVFTPR